MTAYDDVVTRISGTRRVSPRTGQSRAHRGYCPVCQPEGARPGRQPSLSIAERDDGRVLAHCFKGCARGDEILRGLGIHDGGGGGGAKKLAPYDDGGDWISASAAAAALHHAAARLINKCYGLGVIDRDDALDEVLAVFVQADRFQDAAREAMRGAGRREK